MAERTVPHAYPMSTQYELNSPSCIYDQVFGEGLAPQDLMTPTLYHGYYVRPRITKQLGRGFSQIEEESGLWRVRLDVCQFTPDELSVRTVDNLLEVTGSHTQRQDAHGFVSRSFTRTYILPAGVDPLLLQVRLSHDGILVVSATRATPDAPVTHIHTIRTDKTPIRIDKTPVRTDKTPVHTDKTPVHTDKTPVHTDKTPIHTDKTPVHTDKTPIHTDKTPIHTDKTPIRTDKTPIHTDKTPVHTDKTPVHTDKTPIHTDKTPIPTDNTPIRTDKTPVPTDKTPIPTDKTPIPTDKTPIHTDKTPIPTDKTPVHTHKTPKKS